ncbi:unnamed protein product, partial [Darwinula stevensoni]
DEIETIESLGGTGGEVYPECRLSERGKEYVGTRNETETGKPCLRWDTQPYGMPWDFFDNRFPYEEHFFGRNSSLHENHCRNPGLYRRRPWCFVADPNVQWEYCDVPFCTDAEAPECKLTEAGNEYVGKQNVTLSGKQCQHWLQVVPMRHSLWNFLPLFSDDLDGPHNFCRNIGVSTGPWCFSVSGLILQYCDVPFCPNSEGEQCRVRVSGECVEPRECKTTPNGEEYIGTQNVTVSGHPCLAWIKNYERVFLFPFYRSYIPFNHSYIPFYDDLYPSHNFCRNPNSRSGGTWCFIEDGNNTVTDFCDVPMC